MADGVIDNIFLVNAPAGSGKTTWIRKSVESYLIQHPNNNVLCITYTNRAAEELGKDLDSKRVYTGTIHSFINDFISSFFSHSAIIELYWELYNDKIAERIENLKQDPNWKNTNDKYTEKFGSIDLETVRSNLDAISYNEAPFNSLYRGALGHDDLISFTRAVVDRFPVIKKKISDKYQLIFIDEYQDTAADVLHIFYVSVLGKNSQLYLLGDKMQQIYKNYNGEFENEFNSLNRSVNLTTNYRTTPRIVSILNALYNDETLKQTPYERNSDDSMAFAPRVVITSEPEKEVLKIREQFNDALSLYLTNKSRFHDIGAGYLYDAYDKMEKYKFGRKYSAVDVMTKEEARANDVLLTLLFLIDQIVRNYELECFGEVLRSIQRQRAYLNNDKYVLKKHSDKAVLKEALERVIRAYRNSEFTINDFLEVCNQIEFIRKEIYAAILEDPDFLLAKDVCIKEISILSEYLRNPKVSTQHGVKGESHDTVIFVADNSRSNPPVNMSKFLGLWSNNDVNLKEFDSFYYEYSKMIHTVEATIGMKCSELKANTFGNAANTIDNALRDFMEKFVSNPYYNYLLKAKIDKYLEKKNVTNVKECLKEGTVYGPLCAYRLFYVGCSRARKNLVVLINKKDITGFETDLQSKLEHSGFVVEYQE